MEFHVATIRLTVSLALLWLYFIKLFDLLNLFDIGFWADDLLILVEYDMEKTSEHAS